MLIRLVAFVATCLVSVKSQDCVFVKMLDQVSTGGLGKGYLALGKKQDCEGACNELSANPDARFQCKAYVWHPPANGQENGDCFVYKEVKKVTILFQSPYVLYQQACFDIVPNPEVCDYVQIKERLSPNGISNQRETLQNIETEFACYYACAQDRKSTCKGFMHDPTNKLCYVFGNIPSDAQLSAGSLFLYYFTCFQTAQNCVYGPYETGPCSVTCGEGTVTETRVVTTQAAPDGVQCQDSLLTRTRPCVFPACANLVPVDCQYSQWTQWSTCPVTCGTTGTTTRTRTIDVAGGNGGVICDVNSLQESQPCNNFACPRNCVYSDWSTPTPCSATCGPGETKRTRTIVTLAANGGTACDQATLEQIDQCNQGACPSDCQYNQWTLWGDCPVTCGGYQQSRTRSIKQAAQNGGAPCDLVSENKVCGNIPCPTDCVVGAWSPWGQCPVTCGGARVSRSRTVLKEAANNGAPCPVLVSEQDCGITPCPSDCLYSQWNQWSVCQVTCGGSQVTRSRSITQQASNGGACNGLLEDSKSCGTQACPSDCQYSTWSQWSTCTATCGGGDQGRNRAISQAASAGGVSCDVNALEQTRRCNTQGCAIDCQYSQWSPWATCPSDCRGSSSRTRVIEVQGGNGGAACTEPLTVQSTCVEIGCDPARGDPDGCSGCEYSPWTDYGGCSTSCGPGFQERTRSITKEPTTGGTSCGKRILYNYKNCNIGPCIVPVDCRFGNWGNWGACTVSCGGGVQSRNRQVGTPATNGGAECPIDGFREQRSCSASPCPVDCVWTQWGNYGQCSVTCGSGVELRERSIQIQASNGGRDCTGGRVQTKACTRVACITPVDCVYSNWGDYESCSTTCGEGTQKRYRQIIVQGSGGGRACSEPLMTSRNCLLTICPSPVDCQYDQWEEWSVCTQDRRRTRRRGVIAFGSGGGIVCDAEKQIERQPCTPPTDCREDWGPWGVCSVTCGSGTRSRQKQVLTAASNGGKPCVGGREDGVCTLNACPPDCVLGPWSSWTVCTASCNNGVRRRSRINSAACSEPEEAETGFCNPQACPIPCTVTWAQWSQCTKSCGVGKRSTSIVSLSPPNCEPPPGNFLHEDCELTSVCPDKCPFQVVVANFDETALVSRTKRGQTRGLTTAQCEQKCKDALYCKAFTHGGQGTSTRCDLHGPIDRDIMTKPGSTYRLYERVCPEAPISRRACSFVTTSENIDPANPSSDFPDLLKKDAVTVKKIRYTAGIFHCQGFCQVSHGFNRRTETCKAYAYKESRNDFSCYLYSHIGKNFVASPGSGYVLYQRSCVQT